MTREMARHSILSLLLLFAPLYVSADIRITEIMYDLDGSDSGREWVEITNDGSGAVDLTGFKFFEANTNHGLSLAAGSAILPSGGSAIIADDSAKFLADWPGYTGALFTSSFSLSNSGETLGVKRADLTEEDSATYTSDMGAAGDGKSLNRLPAQAGSESSFIAAVPSPGSHDSGATTPTPASSPPSASPSTQSTATSSASGEPTKVVVYAGGQRTVVVGADSVFEANAYGPQGTALQGVRYVWNFGNGDTREGRSVFYAYAYPGKYIVLIAVSGFDGSATGRVLVEALPAHLLVRAETDGSIALLNREAREVEVSGWILRRGGSSFIIPQGTIVLGGEGVRFSPQTTRLLDLLHDPELLYPNGAPAQFVESPAPPPAHSRIGAAEAARLIQGTSQGGSMGNNEILPPPTKKLEAAVLLQEPVSALRRPEEEEQAAAGAALGTLPSPRGNPLWLFMALAGITFAGASAAVLIRGLKGSEIEIIEEKDENE